MRFVCERKKNWAPIEEHFGKLSWIFVGVHQAIVTFVAFISKSVYHEKVSEAMLTVLVLIFIKSG